MAVTATTYGSAQNKTAATTVVFNTTALIPADTCLMLAVCADNVSATTPAVTSITPAVGLAAWLNKSGTIPAGATTTAGSGVLVACWTCFTAAPVASGTTFTVTFDASPVAKAVALWGLSETSVSGRGAVGTGTSTTGSPSAVTTGTALVAGDIVVGIVGAENNAVPTGDADTLNGSWSAITGIASSGSSAATNTAIGMQFKVVTATGAQTFNPTGGVADTAAAVFALVPFVFPALTWGAYRFYADGTETGSTDLAAENTAYTADVTAGDVNLLLRTRLQNTNATATRATDDFQLQWEKNASGTWTNVVAAVNTVVGYNSPNLTNQGATTNRLTAGTGTFGTNGRVSVDGEANDVFLTASNYTELLYSVTLKQADLANGDTIRFRVLRNAATTAMTYTQTPTIPITKATTTGRPKVYLAGAFTKKPLKVWTGAAWVEKPIKVWTGSAWKTLT